MGKTKLLLLLFLLFTLGATADPCVVVTTSSGEAVFFFNSNPKFTFDGQTVKLSANNSEIEYSPTDIQSVKVDDRVNTSIKSVNNNREEVSYSILDNSIILRGCKPNDLVSLYSINGELLSQSRSLNNGDATLSTSNLDNGVYIINSSNSTIKFIKK